MSLRGADGITIDAAGADLVPPAPLDGIVDANHHRGVRADEAGDQQAQQPACHRTGRPHRPVEHAMVDREVGLLLPPKDPQCRGDGSLARRQDGAGHQQQDVLPGRAGELLRQAGEPRQQARRQRELAGYGGGIGLLHRIRRIDAVESQQAPATPSGCDASCTHSCHASVTGKLAAMTEADLTLASIAARFPDLDVAKSRGGYTLIDPATETPLARLKPIPQTDRFELFYWSLVRERWRTFGDFGRLSLTLDRAHEIFRNEAVFHFQGNRGNRTIFR